MKANKIDHGDHHWLIFSCCLVLLVAVSIGAVIGYDKLQETYLEQCVITDMTTQVSITAGKMVHPNNIAEELGIKVGANLGMIDFARKRQELLTAIPNLKSLKISRRLPNRVIVVAEERTPVARMNLKGSTGVTGRVVDTEGVVFIWQRGTQLLPTIREVTPPGTPKGQKITGRTMAALRLIEACREPELLELGILEVDTSKRDFLTATLGNYSKLKILWEGMDEPQTPDSRRDLVNRLTQLRNAIRSRLATDTVIWNATMPNSIFADTQKRL